MKKLIVFLLLLVLLPYIGYAQIWEGDGGEFIQEGLDSGGSGGGSIDWDDFAGDKCTVTFQSLDGVYSQSAVVPVGVPSSYVMSAISVPNRTGYDFGGWSYLNDYPTPIVIPDNFIATQTYYAIYEPHLHDVTFMVDNSVYYVEQNVPYGTAIPLPTPPTYPVIPQDNILYRWDGLPETMPDNDVTVTAVYGIGYWGIDINQTTGQVTYLYRAQNMLPVNVVNTAISNWSDSETSWKSFVSEYAKPCMLKSNGTVDYYLDRTDQRYKEDGITPSDYNNISYDGNAMVELKKMYMKITQPDENTIRVLFSPSKVDSGFTADAFVRENGTEADKIYIGMFIGTVDSAGKIRSISGGNALTGDPSNFEGKAMLNGSGWNIEHYSLRNYLNLMTAMVMKTLNITVIGFNETTPTGTIVNNTDFSSLAAQDAFCKLNLRTYKIFWISDYFVNNHAVRGIAYDFTNKYWLYRATPPYSFSSTANYYTCATSNLTFKVTNTYSQALIDKMTVVDNLLFPYTEHILGSSDDNNNNVTAYGNSFLTKFDQGGSITLAHYVGFGSHGLAYQHGVGDCNIWEMDVLNTTFKSTWPAVFKACLTYVP